MLLSTNSEVTIMVLDFPGLGKREVVGENDLDTLYVECDCKGHLVLGIGRGRDSQQKTEGMACGHYESVDGTARGSRWHKAGSRKQQIICVLENSPPF